jgi:hypothetical protein
MQSHDTYGTGKESRSDGEISVAFIHSDVASESLVKRSDCVFRSGSFESASWFRSSEDCDISENWEVQSHNDCASGKESGSHAQISFVFVNSILLSFASNAPRSNQPTESGNLPFSANLANSPLCPVSLSIPEAFLTNVDARDSSTKTLCQSGACAKASEGSAAKAGTVAVSIGGTIGGLLAVVAAVILVIVIQRRRQRNEADNEGESGADFGIVEAMTVFEPSDQYISEIRSEELVRLSHVVE